jgi:prepilin-type N-terminal cleavage/methylation domain-containing protein
MIKRLQRGFTLIELLVVIAIIGILAAVVLASLNDARDSGQDASIKQSLGNARSQAELRYNQNGFSYADVCASAPIVQLTTAAVNNRAETTPKTLLVDTVYTANRVACHDTAAGYMIMAPLNVGTDLWCVDSAGFAGAVASGNMASAADIGCAAGVQS